MNGYELLERLVQFGELTIIDHDGRRITFGQKESGRDEPCVTWRLNKPGVINHILTNPRLNLGETYMNGNWDIAQGTLHDLLSILRINLESSVAPRNGRATLMSTMGRILQSWNSIRTSYRNVGHHYDLDEVLFRACLDDDLHYSCAYFEHPQITLEQAQRAKCDLIAAKLCLEDGQHVLDIGGGWGSLAIALCQAFDIRVTGLTLSHKQMQTARARVRACGLETRIDIRQMDYREHTGRYDRVVSVGMFEHVGKRNYTSMLHKISDSLTSEGVALLHTIGSRLPPEPTNPWIRRHIFPGGYLPSLSEVAQSVEKSHLHTVDVEIWREHYAMTLAAWNANFQRHRARFVHERGERFCRMWEFYLVISQTSFEAGITTVQHWQLARHHLAVPITRNYLYQDSKGAAGITAQASLLKATASGTEDSAAPQAARSDHPQQGKG